MLGVARPAASVTARAAGEATGPFGIIEFDFDVAGFSAPDHGGGGGIFKLPDLGATAKLENALSQDCEDEFQYRVGIHPRQSNLRGVQILFAVLDRLVDHGFGLLERLRLTGGLPRGRMRGQ